MWQECAFVFPCQGRDLIGIIHHADPVAPLGVMILVGGSQYRVGSHRQFVLLARSLAASGIPVMRFDYRGMGDSGGEKQAFDAIFDDIRAAIKQFFEHCPSLMGVVLWALCDAASAGVLYAHQDSRVHGLVLLNPWLYTEQGAAKTYLKHYYLKRFLSSEFWRKLFSLKFDYSVALAGFADLLQKARKPEGQKTESADAAHDLPGRVRLGLRQFKHPVLLVLSGQDFTADEFRDAIKDDKEWQARLNDGSITRRDLEEADHTFAKAAWREQVTAWTLAWLKSIAG